MSRENHAILVSSSLAIALLLMDQGWGGVSAFPALDRQTVFTMQDPEGGGLSVYTIFYHLPQVAYVGTQYNVTVKLYVTNFTRLKVFLQDWTVQVALRTPSGRVISGQEGITATQTAENLGALQLHAGQNWGPVNITLPITQSNSGLLTGQALYANATLRLDADVWYTQPINFFKPEGNETSIGQVIMTNGTPSPQPNYPGFGLLAAGVVLVVSSLAIRQRGGHGSGAGRMKKPPGSV